MLSQDNVFSPDQIILLIMVIIAIIVIMVIWVIMPIMTSIAKVKSSVGILAGQSLISAKSYISQESNTTSLVWQITHCLLCQGILGLIFAWKHNRRFPPIEIHLHLIFKT